MNKFVMYFVLCISMTIFSAQFEIVKDVYEDTGTITAQKYGYKDHNNEYVAILKVKTDIEGLAFRSMTLDKSEYMGSGIYHVYMQPGSRMLEFMKTGFISIKHQFPRRLESNKVYVIEVKGVGGKIEEITITIQTKPSGAEIFLDDENFGYVEQIKTSVGTHRLKLKRSGYLDKETMIQVTPDNNYFKIDLEHKAENNEIKQEYNIEENIESNPNDYVTKKIIDNEIKNKFGLGIVLYGGINSFKHWQDDVVIHTWQPEYLDSLNLNYNTLDSVRQSIVSVYGLKLQYDIGQHFKFKNFYITSAFQLFSLTLGGISGSEYSEPYETDITIYKYSSGFKKRFSFKSLVWFFEANYCQIRMALQSNWFGPTSTFKSLGFETLLGLDYYLNKTLYLEIATGYAQYSNSKSEDVIIEDNWLTPSGFILSAGLGLSF